MAKIGRNDRCPCGSGKKYKQCCLAKDDVAERRPVAAASAAEDHLPHHHPRLCAGCNAKIDTAANAVIALIDARKLDDAEHAAQALVERWPDMPDGYDCLGMVCQARGNNRQAAEYYRKVLSFARKEPRFYDPEFFDYYRDLLDRLEPMAPHMGALPPNPRDI
jgi:tetratricopeptide (TPR) repeat protein